MNDSKIKVLLVEPEKYPKEIVIDNTLEAMQEVVGGDIEEYMPYDDDVAIICNEEGKMRGLPLNRAVYMQDNDKKEMIDIICGKFFICYAPPESESFQSLPDDMMKKYKEQFKYPERFSKDVGGNIVAEPFKPKSIGITPIVAPKEVYNQGLWKEKVQIVSLGTCAMIDVRMDFESYYNADSDGKIQLIEEMLIKAIKKVKTKGKFDLEKFKEDLLNCKAY